MSVRIVSRQRGFTLMEIMVALLIIGVGLLGVAALQSTAMKRTHDAALRTQASALGSSIVNAMRANAQAVESSAYDVGWDGLGSSSGIVKEDVQRWQDELDGALPGAQGKIDITDQAGGARHRVVVKICWQGRAVDDDQSTPQAEANDCPAAGMQQWTMATHICSGGPSSCM